MTLQQRRILLVIAFLWAIALLFVPIRTEIITGIYTGDTPETQKFIAANSTETCSIAIGFKGHPGGIVGLLFFLLMPFFIVWESFSFKRPFSYGANAFMKLQALLLFLGAPYCYYIATYEQGYYYDRQHETILAWGGWWLFAQNILLGIFVFTALAAPNSRIGRFFPERN